MASVTLPVIVPFGPSAAGGVAKSSAGSVSLPLTAAAKKPMPRPANTVQIVSWLAPPLAASSAARMALRMSRNVGSVGERRMPSVTSCSARADPAASRRSHSVCAQISPSECTSGPPPTSP